MAAQEAVAADTLMEDFAVPSLDFVAFWFLSGVAAKPGGG
jgi:hypothetical protein